MDKDPFIGKFTIYFINREVILNTEIVNWRMNSDGGVLFLINENGSVINFQSVTKMIRINED